MARGTRRDWKKGALWRRRLESQAGSGISIRAWCRRHGVHESAFYWWRTQLARRDAAAPRGPTRVPPPFAPVRIVTDTALEAAGRIEIVLPGERRVHVIGRVERGTLVEVLAALVEVPWVETVQHGLGSAEREASGC